MGKFDLNMLRVDVKREFKDIRIRVDGQIRFEYATCGRETRIQRYPDTCGRTGAQSSDKEFGSVPFSDRASVHSFLNYSKTLI